MPVSRPAPTPGAQWATFAVRLGAREEAARRDGADLQARYDEPHRRYHTGEHVRAVVADAAELGGWLQLAPDEQDLVGAAACAHDVVYDARPGEDERASAAWARRALTDSGVHPSRAARVGELIGFTATHDAPGHDHLAHALLDADLAILAAAAPVYARYVEAVRREYSRVPDADWRTGRAAVLRSLVGRAELYFTARARELWDRRARANVAAELSALAGTS